MIDARGGWTRADVEDPDLREDVVVYEQRAICVRRDGAGGSAAGAQLEGSLRVPARVDDERIPQSTQAVQHNEGRRQPRLQGLRHRHADRLRLEVLTISTTPAFTFQHPLFYW